MSDLTNAEKRAICFEFYDWLRSHVATSLVVARTDVEAEVMRMYPDPASEPKVVTMETTGHQYRIHQGHVDFRPDPDDDWYHGGGFTPSDLVALGEIAQEYYDNQRTS